MLNRFLLLISAALFLLVFAGTAAAQSNQIWLSPDGRGTNLGTKASPLKTLRQGKQTVRRLLRNPPNENIAVILAGGTYQLKTPLQLTDKDSAASGHQVVWRAQSGQRPVISGGQSVPSRAWSKFDSKQDIWRAKVGQINTRQLYVNGSSAQRAVTEDYPAGFLPSYGDGGPTSGIRYLPTTKPNGINPSSWGDPRRWTNVDDIEATILTQWKMMTVPLKSVTAAQGDAPGLLKMANPAWDNANVFRSTINGPQGPEAGPPGIWSFWQVTRFENAYQFLDSAGEWYLDRDRGWLYYKPQPWERMRSSRVVVPVLQSLIEGDHVRNISFRGLQFSYATWNQPSGPNGYVDDQAGFHLVGKGHQPNIIGHDPDDQATPGNISFSFDKNIRFINNRFIHLGAVGLSFGRGSQSSVTKSNSFKDTGSSAVQLGGIGLHDHHPKAEAQVTRNNTISGNLIDGTSSQYLDAPAIVVGFTRGSKIRDNTIQNIPYSGISIGWGWGLLDPTGFPGVPGASWYQWGHYNKPTPNRNSVIAGNRISNFLQVLWDGGAVYTLGAQGTSLENGLVIKHNTAFNKRPQGGGNTFYTDGGSRYIVVRDNTSYNNPIGNVNLGPPPQTGDPLPYPATPSDGNFLPYGSDIGGCVTYGDISYIDNSWFEAPMELDMALNNDIYDLATAGKIKPYAPSGFFDVCPYSYQGIDYPTRLSFAGNTIYPD